VVDNLLTKKANIGANRRSFFTNFSTNSRANTLLINAKHFALRHLLKTCSIFQLIYTEQLIGHSA